MFFPGVTYPTAEEWTSEDDEAAFREGWTLAAVEDTDYGHLQIQKADEVEKFDGDFYAWAFVRKMAAEGFPVESKALALVKKYNPAEYKQIMEVSP